MKRKDYSNYMEFENKLHESYNKTRKKIIKFHVRIDFSFQLRQSHPSVQMKESDFDKKEKDKF